jgi:hypothetical protein
MFCLQLLLEHNLPLVQSREFVDLVLVFSPNLDLISSLVFF